jgi:ABC-type Fe3+-hydroxamate transport system substrate-binding protein
MLLQTVEQLQHTPKRIVSLVPSQTELLYYLGLDEVTIGITKFCVHPNSWFKTKTRVGGTKNVNLQTIHTLQPDLIIANKEENVQEQVIALANLYNVWVTDVNNLTEALQMIKDIGALTNTSSHAQTLIGGINAHFTQLQKPLQPIPTAYLIWQNPYMAAASSTFINDMMQRCGLQNVFIHLERYPAITIEQLQQSNCKLLLLSSEPYPFKEKDIALLQELLPNTKILLADGEMFSWYGSRLLLAPSYFATLLQQAG